MEDILRYWLRARDEDGAGFNCWIGPTGHVRGTHYNSLIINSRLLYNYAEGIRAGHDFCEEPARFLYDYIMGPLRCDEGWHTSFYHGERSPSEGFGTYDNLYVVIALARYSMATGDRALLDQAWQLFRLIEEHTITGRLEECGLLGNWGGGDRRGRRGRRGSVHTYSGNTNLHYLEALGCLAAAGIEEDLSDRVRALREFFLSYIWDEGRGVVHDMFFDGYATPWTGPGARTSLAHGLEWFGFFREFEGLSLPAETERRILSMALEHSVLEDGFFQDAFYMVEGRTAGFAQFWTQSEAVLGFHVARAVYGEEYEDALMRLTNYYFDHFVDEDGSIFSEIDRNGVVVDRDKGDVWKADYHSVRMCVDAINRDGDWFDG